MNGAIWNGRLWKVVYVWVVWATFCCGMIACVASAASARPVVADGSSDANGEYDPYDPVLIWAACGGDDNGGGGDDGAGSGNGRQQGGGMSFLMEPMPIMKFVEWTPDGSEIVFSEHGDGAGVVVSAYESIQSVDASGASLRALHVGESSHRYGFGVHADISPDGSLLTYTTCDFRAEDEAEAVNDQTYRKFIDQASLSREYIKRLRFYEIGTVKIDGTTPERLTRNRYNDFFPAWSPRGDALAFLADPGAYGIHAYREFRIMAADGSDGKSIVVIREEDLQHRATLYSPNFASYPPQWSPDGQRVAVLVTENSFGRERLFQEKMTGRWSNTFSESWGLYIVSGDGNYGREAALRSRGFAERLTATVGGVSWSPDGARIALMKIVDDDVALVTIAADGSDLEVITRLTDQEISDARRASATVVFGGNVWLHPVSWSPDGSHILFRCGERLCVVGLDGERVGAWPLESLDQRSVPQAAWSPDGSRLAVVGEFDAGPISSDQSYRTVLFTMAPDGTDVRFLVGRPGKGKLEALGARRVETPMTSGFCALGEAVPYPDVMANANEVRDCETLLRLRDTLAGSLLLDWGAKLQRHGNKRRMSEWEGVTVLRPLGFGRVYELELPERRLAGTIPAELSGLAELTRLSLPSNDLHGSIPPELGQLTNLTHLDLRDNELTGPIPAELGALVNLEVLYLGGNQLTGCIPPALHEVPDNDLASLGLPACEPG